MEEIYRRTALNSLFTGLLMTAVGFFLFSSQQHYWPASLLVVVMRVGGLAMFAVAFAAWWRSPFTFRLDVVCSGLIGVCLLGIGIIWVINSPRELTPYALLIFGWMCLRNARDSYRMDACQRAEEAAGLPPRAPEPPADDSLGENDLGQDHPDQREYKET